MACASTYVAPRFADMLPLQSSLHQPPRQRWKAVNVCRSLLSSDSKLFRVVPNTRRQRMYFSGAQKSDTQESRKRCCRAASESNDVSTSQTDDAPAAKRYVRRPKVKVPSVDPNLKAYAVEDENVVVEGVAKIDRGVETVAIGRLALLVAGDAAALLIFALLGKVSHAGTADFGVVQTAAPFLVGWFSIATLLGAFGPNATLAGPSKAALTAGPAWAVGIPLGIVIRGVLKGQVPPTPFIVVTLVSTFVLLVGWRAALAATGGSKAVGDRDGNPFEFLELLTSLVRRW